MRYVKKTTLRPAFTVVELLIVIVVIGILAGLTIVAYKGITQNAHEVSLKSDVSKGAKLLEISRASHKIYPLTTSDVDTAVLKASRGNTLTYTGSADGKDYCLQATGYGSSFYTSTSTNGTPKKGDCSTIIAAWGGGGSTPTPPTDPEPEEPSTPLTCATGGSCVIGDTGPGGGIVFYDKGSFSDGWQYFEVAPAGWNGGAQDPQAQWGCRGTNIATSEAVGAGKNNTDLIVSGCSQAGIAAKLAKGYHGGGKSDWFLPSYNEIMIMDSVYVAGGPPSYHEDWYWMTILPGMTANEWYWSSSQLGSEQARSQEICAVCNSVSYKDAVNYVRVRPIRRF